MSEGSRRLVNFQPPAFFVLSQASFPTSGELGFGVSEGWISGQDAVLVCSAKGRAGIALSEAEEKIVLLSPSELRDADRALRDLEITDQPRESRARIWLFLALAWLFEHEAQFDEPLQVIEMLYADFESPPRSRGLSARCRLLHASRQVSARSGKSGQPTYNASGLNIEIVVSP